MTYKAAWSYCTIAVRNSVIKKKKKKLIKARGR